jgi:spore coat polysaccharide biosynthesis protein SpsF (cytidylyltransferase family)
MSRTVVVVQARMGSTRLPGKVMMDLAGQSVLAHVLERCAAIPGVERVCCATVEGAEGDPVAAEAARRGAEVFRGSEQDVLDRYHGAAGELGSDIVMRVTSDCPLIDPAICGEVLALRARLDADYACNNMPPSWPHGLDCEAFTFAWLARAAKEARKPSEREHVSPFIRNHPDATKANLAGPGGAVLGHRWTLDTQADLDFLRALFERLPPGAASWDYRVPLDLVEQDPALAAINAGQDRDAGLKKSQAADAAMGYGSG